MIDRVRLTATAKNQLATLKRRLNVDHNNAICRHALCISLNSASLPPAEVFNFNGGLEIDWKVLTGANEDLYMNLICLRQIEGGGAYDEDALRSAVTHHIHRGLSYMMSKTGDLAGELLALID